MTDKTIVLTTWPDLAGAEAFAKLLVEKRLAACINVLPEMRSIYQWQGKLEQGAEHQLIIKTTVSRYADVEATIVAHHPYALPEILCIPVTAGFPGYLSWIEEATHAEK